MATQPLPSKGSSTLHSGGENRVMAHKWATCLDNPCRLGGAQRFTVGDKVSSGHQRGKMATYPLPPRGSPTLQGQGQNQHWPTSEPSGYIPPTAWGAPNASARWTTSKGAHKGAGWLHIPTALGFVAWPLELGLGSLNSRFAAWPLELGLGTRNPRFAVWPLELGLGTLNPRFVVWPLELGLGTLNPQGSPTLQSRGQNQKGPTRGAGGCIPFHLWGSPTLEGGGPKRKWPTSGPGG